LLESHFGPSNYLPRRLSDLKAECTKRQLKSSGSKSELVDRLAAHDLVNSQGFHTTAGHRPTASQLPQIYRTIPMMQGFKSSASVRAPRDNSTIDFFFFPQIEPAPPINPFEKLRVPLLPDNYNPDRSPGSPNAIETFEARLPNDEVIMASHPEQIMPATMSEVVGNDELDLDAKIDELTEGLSSRIAELKEPGMLRELWGSVLDDILGPKSKTAI